MPIGDQVGRRDDDIPRRIHALETFRNEITALAGSAKAIAAAVQTGLGNLASSGTTWAGAVNDPTGGGVATTGTVSGANVSTSGNVTASGNVAASGQVSSQQPLKSPGSVTYHVTTGYVATWTNGDGTIGTSPSTAQAKTDLVLFTAADADRLLSIPAYWGRYVWDDPTSPPKVFVLAEDVQAAGFGPDVAPIVEAAGTVNIGTDAAPILLAPGQAWTVNYSQLVVPLIAGYRSLSARVAALEAR